MGYTYFLYAGLAALVSRDAERAQREVGGLDRRGDERAHPLRAEAALLGVEQRERRVAPERLADRSGARASSSRAASISTTSASAPALARLQ